MSRIAVGGFGHETNSFVTHRADYAYFADHRDRPPLVRGEEIFKWLASGAFPISSFMADIKADHTLVPLAWAHGGAGGPVTADAFERIVGELTGALSRSLPVDGVYLDLHGAMAAEPFEDAEGELLRRVRAIVGDVPVVVSLDYHANITPLMVDSCDGMVIFQTYPHIDRTETGERAARLMRHLLDHPRPGGRALRKMPFLLPITMQCTMTEPSGGIAAQTKLLQDDLISLSYAAGFPPSDLYWCGPAVVAYAATQQQADAAADALAAHIADLEGAFRVDLLSPEASVTRAMKIARSASRPVIIADAQDNPGAGGSADTTGLLQALIDADAQNAVVGILCDPAAAQLAHAAGEGQTVQLDLGGHNGPDGVHPVSGTYTVLKLGSGKFHTTGAVTGGLDVDLGPMALLGIGGVKVVVSSKRMQAMDQGPFRHVGIEPCEQAILVVKSAVHFRADFQPIAEEVIVAAAPGGCSSDPAAFPYRHLREGVRLSPLGPTFKAGG